MEAATTPAPALPPLRPHRPREADQFRVRRRALEVVLENCRRALELLEDADLGPDSDKPRDEGYPKEAPSPPGEGAEEEDEERSPLQSQSASDSDTDELCSLLKSKVESPKFLEKLGSIQTSIYQNIHDDNASWDMVTTTDLWEDEHVEGENDLDQDGYVLVSQEDIVDGIACFMAAYLLSLKETKELTPNQLQEALSKAFSVKKKKSRLRKAWEGSQVVYNVASWGATAVGIYQNPAILKAASVAFWSSCNALSKLF